MFAEAWNDRNPDAPASLFDEDAEFVAVGRSTTADGWEHAFAWTAAGGMVDLGTLGGPGSAATFVNEAGTIVGTSDRPGRQGQHAFVWTAAEDMVEMPSLGRVDGVSTMSANGSFAGFTSGKKSAEDQHAVLWAPATPGGVR